MPIRIRQAAAAIGVSTKVLMELEREGLIQPLRSRGGHRYFTPELIEAARRAYSETETERGQAGDRVSVP